jgi:hypothetical protein
LIKRQAVFDFPYNGLIVNGLAKNEHRSLIAVSVHFADSQQTANWKNCLSASEKSLRKRPGDLSTDGR